MAHQQRALAGLVEDLCSILSTHTVVPCIYSPRGYNALFRPLQVPSMHMMHMTAKYT